MIKDILVIVMMAFGLFAILMFILFYVYLKKHYNDKHVNYDYQKDDNDNDFIDNHEEKKDHQVDNDVEDEFVPKRKK